MMKVHCEADAVEAVRGLFALPYEWHRVLVDGDEMHLCPIHNSANKRNLADTWVDGLPLVVRG